jgi:orotidine-5'-phosphate decarboxylase
MNAGPRVIVALDFAAEEEALALVDLLDPGACRVKVGKELFTRGGPDVVERLTGKGFDVFLDLKFHDIPSTVAKACRAAADLSVWMLNVHALGGRAMMEAAREAVSSAAGRPLLVAVTVLTSLDERSLAEVGLGGSVEDNVLRLARLAAQSGLDGVVCSPWEAADLRRNHGPDFRLVTPGVRLPGAASDDQRRTLAPAEALARGADYLVVGRPITQAPNPKAALKAILADVETSKH